MGIFSSSGFKCARCERNTQPLGYAPLPTDLGQRVGAEVCAECWREWLQKQQQLINHFGLDVSNPDTHTVLFDQMKIFFYGEGVNVAEIDTSKEGSVQW